MEWVPVECVVLEWEVPKDPAGQAIRVMALQEQEVLQEGVPVALVGSVVVVLAGPVVRAAVADSAAEFPI